jgi:DNA-binding LacI/PurR family transcriptional regulator/DNA-binding transcriptional regulator YhcF (GntR family)
MMFYSPRMKRSIRKAIPGPRSAPRLRPREKVIAHLMAEIERPGARAGARLPTVRDLVARVGVSTTTVQAAFRQLNREGRIRSKVGSGTFLVSTASHEPSRLSLGLNLSADYLQNSASGDPWQQSIYTGVLQQVLALHKEVRMVSLLPKPSHGASKLRRATHFSPPLDGVILFPTSDPREDARWHAHFEKQDCPVVSLNPPSLVTTANFVMPNYFESGERIGQAFRKSGRRNILFLHHHSYGLSVSDRLRLGGLLAGLSPGTGCEILCGYPPSATQAPLHDRLKQFLLKASTKNDAIYCTGDWLAVETFLILRELGRKVPEAVSVIGGTGIQLGLTRCPNLTRLAQPLQQMGRELFSMLIHRIRAKGASLPGRILPTPFLGGATTLPSENALLGLSSR